MTLELRVIQTLNGSISHERCINGLTTDLPDIESGVDGGLGSRPLSGGIDGGQDWLRTRDLAGGSDLFVTHCGFARLCSQKALKVEGSLP